MIVNDNKIKYIIHLAAQAGVRHSIENQNLILKVIWKVFLTY